MKSLQVSLLVLGLVGMTAGHLFSADTKDAKGPSDAVKALVKKLQSKNPADRIKAANELEKLGDEAKPVLWELVSTYIDTTPQIRLAARDALEKIDPKLFSLVEPLVEPKRDAMPSQTHADKRQKCLYDLMLMREKGRPAIPALFYFASFTQRPSSPHNNEERLGFKTAVDIAPDEPYVLNGLIYYAQLREAREPSPVRGRVLPFSSVARAGAISAMRGAKYEQRGILPVLIALLKNPNEERMVRVAALETLGVHGLGSNEAEQAVAAVRADKKLAEIAQETTTKLKDYREKKGASDVLKAPAKSKQ